MISRYHWKTIDTATRARILARAGSDITHLVDEVRPIVEAVRDEGDAALLRFTSAFDGVDIAGLGIAVSEVERRSAGDLLRPEVRAALDTTIANVQRFHAAQARHEVAIEVEVAPGIRATERPTPIDAVGLYVPSGRGSFPSMMYMLAVPAVAAGVPTIAVVTPPRADGSVDPAVLYAADRCGVTAVFRVGGPHAVAALAYGTASIPRVNKIIGPGSARVAAAKRLVSDRVDTGLPAGPSESMILADATADPWLVALDLVIEAEHGSDSAALLVTPDGPLADRVALLISELIDEAPEPRRTFLSDVFSGYGGIIETTSREEAVSVVNGFAPEHLMIHSTDARSLAAEIRNASEILIGPHTAFSLANYATGPNAVLPTGGWARTWGPVSVRDFQKRASVIEVDEVGYVALRDHVIALADYEGFPMHAAALRRRDERRVNSPGAAADSGR